MKDNVNKLRTYFYLFVVVLLIGFLIYYAFKNKPNQDDLITLAINDQTHIAPWPPDLVPHIREIEEPKREPKRDKGESKEDYEKRKQDYKDIRDCA